MDKRYSSQQSEAAARSLWDRKNVYEFTPQEGKEIFSIDTPPPTVSGELHIGHIFSYTHTDIIARYKRLRGFNVFYPMGFDDNGLPTERFVEKKHKTKAHLMKRSEFIKLCLEESTNIEKDFEQLWKTMGLSVDWHLTYSTISERARKLSQYSFIELHKKGFIYRKEEPALYCTTCQTSVAQAELDSKELPSTLHDIIFTTVEGEKLTIATTRPELLPACVSVFYNPADKRYKHLRSQTAITPLYGRNVPIIADENVGMEKGSGLVMCCTFGDQTDIMWYKRHKLPFIQVVGFDGKWTSQAGKLSGLRAIEARKKIVELLHQEGTLTTHRDIRHAVSVHERCSQPIEFLILNQWFIKILEHKDTFLEMGKHIHWYPKFMHARFRDWVENLGWDWCISRQRFYGIPFPVWHCRNCSHVILANENDLPIDPQEQPFPGGTCPDCGSDNIAPDCDVMDTWNTSSLTPHLNIGWPEKVSEKLPSIPMSLRPQAHDIIRTWAFYTIVKTYFHNKTIPWNDIVISGHVLAGKEKLSKSKEGSRLAPEKLLEAYPADVVRYWTAGSKLGVDTAFSENQFKIGNRLLTKLWNAFRFCSEHIEGYKRPSQTPNLDTLNQWLLHALCKTIKDYTTYFDRYEYSHALETVEKFFWHHFCDNYLELVKDQFFNPENYTEEARTATQFTLHETGVALLQLFAPFLPHITETIYQALFKLQETSQSLHVTTLDLERFAYTFPEQAAVMKNIVSIVTQVRKLKTEHKLSRKIKLAQLAIYVEDSHVLETLKENQTIIAGTTLAQAIMFIPKTLATSSLRQEGDMWHATIAI